jgi:Tol biopolymer transport system component
LSPSGEKVAFILEKQNRNLWKDGLKQLWIVDRDRRNLILLTSYDTYRDRTYTSLRDAYWSPDNASLVYSAYIKTYDDYGREKDHFFELWMMKPDGTEKTRIESIGGGSYVNIAGIQWSPDGKKVAYAFNTYDENDNFIERLRLNDKSGNKEDLIDLANLYEASFQWLNPEKIILTERGALWLLDATGDKNHLKISEKNKGEVHVAPDGHSFTFITSEKNTGSNTASINISDADGNTNVLYSLTAQGQCCCPYFGRVVWSPDSRKIAFTETAGDCNEGCFCDDQYPRHSVIDVRTYEKTFTPSKFSGLLKWLSDGSFILGADCTYLYDSETDQSLSTYRC